MCVVGQDGKHDLNLHSHSVIISHVEVFKYLLKQYFSLGHPLSITNDMRIKYYCSYVVLFLPMTSKQKRNFRSISSDKVSVIYYYF